uniref:hypothetical protein n=1 Tax=Brevibacillus composti TaxID=2796470 RepID=UPI001E3FBB78|nr:hypothetical protein [Brevibacillus composti]
MFLKVLDLVREAMSYAITTTFLTGAIIAAVAVVITLFLKEIPLRSGKKPERKTEKMELRRKGAPETS